MSLFGRLKSTLGGIANRVAQWLIHINWTWVRKKSGWIAANLAVNLLPVALVVIVLVATATLTPARYLSPAALMPPLILAAPLIFIATVGLKAKLDMPRVFSFTPSFLKGLRKSIMISGPVIAVITIAAAAIQMSPNDRGWLFILGPLYGGAIIGTALVLGLAVLLIELATKYAQNKRPPPPRQGPLHLDDPLRV